MGSSPTNEDRIHSSHNYYEQTCYSTADQAKVELSLSGKLAIKVPVKSLFYR